MKESWPEKPKDEGITVDTIDSYNFNVADKIAVLNRLLMEETDPEKELKIALKLQKVKNNET